KSANFPTGLRPGYFSRAPVHAGNGVEPRDLLLKRAQSLLDLVAEPFDSSFQIINLCQMLRDQKALMRFKAARERFHQLLALFFESALRPTGKLLRISL